MTSKERVLKTLDHKEPDRVPIGEWGIDHDIGEKVLGRETYWRNRKKEMLALWAGKRDEVVESYKKDLVELIEKLNHDLVPVHFVPPKNLQPQKIKQIDEKTWKDERGFIYKYSSGNDAIYCTNSGPDKSFHSREELKKYFESVYIPDSGFKIKSDNGGRYELKLEDESRLELVRYAVNKLGSEKFIFARDFSEFTLAFPKTSEGFFIFIAEHTDLSKEAFDIITDVNIAKAKIYIKEGVDAIMPGGDFSNSIGPMISPESIRKIFLPGMKRLSDCAHDAGVRVMSHNCGNNWKMMDILIEAGYECWQSIACKTADMDLKRLKEKYGGKITFWGGINIETLHDGTPEENKKDVLYALKYAAPGGGFILGSSNSVSFGSKHENYIAALESVRKYGNYPISL